MNPHCIEYRFACNIDNRSGTETK